MKNILTAFILYTITTLLFIAYVTSANACQLSIPESYIPTFLNPPVSGHYERCEDKPEEKCHCVESIDPWVSEIVDNEVLDYIAKLNEQSCDNDEDCEVKFQSLVCDNEKEKIKNLDQLQVYCAKEVMKIDGKKLVNSEVKKAAHEAKKQAEKELELSNKAAKKALKLSIKDDIKTATTVAKLKAVIEKMIELEASEAQE